MTSTRSRTSRKRVVVGKIGTVTHAVRDGRPGEVMVRIRGGTEI
jgi:hypothetical protein